MVIIREVLVIFNTGGIYSCSSNKEGFVEIEEIKFTIKLRAIAKDLYIYGFGIL